MLQADIDTLAQVGYVSAMPDVHLGKGVTVSLNEPDGDLQLSRLQFKPWCLYWPVEKLTLPR